MDLRGARPIDLAGGEGSLEPFSVLDDLADRCRIAFVGEMDHFVAEKTPARLLACRYLASRGWRHFGEEWPEAEHQRPFERGILANDRQPTAALDADHRRFRDGLAAAAPEARWFSFDADGRDTDYVDLAESATTYAELAPAMALRERIMHRKVARVLDAHPGEKVALLAAAQHLLKDDDAVCSAVGEAGPGGDSARSIGHHVTHERTPDQPVLSLWILHGRGHSANPWIPAPGALAPQRGTVDAALLRRVGRPCLLPVRAERRARKVTAMHNQVLECRLADQVDAILFVPTVTPLSA